MPKLWNLLNVNEWNDFLSRLPKPVILCGDFNAHHFSWGSNFSDKYGSDHYPILLKLRGVPKARKYNPSWNCKKADWTKYQSEIGKNLESFNSNDPVRAYDFFINAINSAARKIIPMKNGDLNAKCAKPVWWNEECDKLIRERRQAEKIYRQKSSYENFVVCNTINSNIRRIFKKKKKHKWYQLTDNLKPNISPREVFAMIKRLKNFVEPVNSNENIPHEIREGVMDYYAPAGVESCIENCYKSSSLLKDHMLLKPFSLWELNLVFGKNTDTAPGKDLIFYSMISNLPFSANKIFIEIINNVWLTPEKIREWNDYVLIFIKKAQKNPSIISSYRPISLASCVAKVKGLGTYDNLSIFSADLHLSNAKNNYVVALFSDIKGAYDNVIPEILSKAMNDIGLPHKFSRAITAAVFERNVYFKINDRIIGPRKMYKGLPQGDILSPILYALYVRNIEYIWEPGTKILQYADDVVVYVEKQSLQEAIDVMSRNIEHFHVWLAKKGLELSDDKSSKAIIFTDNKSCIMYYVIWNNIARLVEGGHNVKLLWVKAHSGIVGNEEADKLAKRASEHGPQVKVAMYKDFLNKVSQRINIEWQKDWNVSSQTRGQYYKRIKPVVDKKLWQEQFKEEDRRVLVTVTRLRLNHGLFPTHMFRLKLVESDQCACGGASGTCEHIVMELLNVPICSQYFYGYHIPSMQLMVNKRLSPFCQT
ncbi:uncharacterized protein LOC113375702 [Ctenocephalides felis]|uniref:uncharacterized protein LOC113375702 n=1 Tax=Ctenocephalides felis TaxID=7515 RepID=UPI000E6E4B28|nr:uncharacterized protein LOC113375702 [Ctenocephalides felis]